MGEKKKTLRISADANGLQYVNVDDLMLFCDDYIDKTPVVNPGGSEADQNLTFVANVVTTDVMRTFQKRILELAGMPLPDNVKAYFDERENAPVRPKIVKPLDIKLGPDGKPKIN